MILISEALQDNPNSEFYYRPHPDIYYGNREKLSNIKHLTKNIVINDPKYSLIEDIIDCTIFIQITSLGGFEAFT